MNAEIVIFGGSAHPELGDEICSYLGVERSPVLTTRFANDCLQVQLQANCRERDVYLIQPLVPPAQENLMELLLMADAARGASAARVTAVIPHYSYARSDKKDAPRISIGGRLVADLLVTAGVNRVLTLTLHSPEVHGFFSVPVDHLHALRELTAHFRQRDLSRVVVLSPDLGYAKSAAAFARRLGVPVAAGSKERFSDSQVSISSIIGEVADRDVIVLDDEIARGTTVLELLSVLRRQEPRSISVACTHGVFADGALEKLAAAEDVAEIVCTNSVPTPIKHPKLTVLSVAPALAEAIRRTHDGESVSVLFEQLSPGGGRPPGELSWRRPSPTRGLPRGAAAARRGQPRAGARRAGRTSSFLPYRSPRRPKTGPAMAPSSKVAMLDHRLAWLQRRMQAALDGADAWQEFATWTLDVLQRMREDHLLRYVLDIGKPLTEWGRWGSGCPPRSARCSGRCSGRCSLKRSRPAGFARTSPLSTSRCSCPAWRRRSPVARTSPRRPGAARRPGLRRLRHVPARSVGCLLDRSGIGLYGGAMGEDHWHRPLFHVRSGELTGDTGQTPGMARREAISGKTAGAEKLWMGQTHVAAGAKSGNHHHGEAETAIYVVSGTPAFVFADGGQEIRLEAKPGDYIFVPPYVPHREENPGADEAIVVIARSSQQGIVVNLESLWPAS